MVWDWLRRRPYWIDGAIVLALLAGYVGGAAHQHRYRAGIALALVQVLPLLLRRRFPVAVLWIVSAATVVVTLTYRNFVPFAAAGSAVSDSSPARAREALRSIETTGRAALAGLRRLLGVVRDGAEYEPQPGLARLDALLDQVRAAGLDVRLSVEGPPREVPAG